MPKSKLRPVRIADDPWNPACARAAADGVKIAAVTTELLRLYAAGEIDVDLERMSR